MLLHYYLLFYLLQYISKLIITHISLKQKHTFFFWIWKNAIIFVQIIQYQINIHFKYQFPFPTKDTKLKIPSNINVQGQMNQHKDSQFQLYCLLLHVNFEKDELNFIQTIGTYIQTCNTKNVINRTTKEIISPQFQTKSKSSSINIFDMNHQPILKQHWFKLIFWFHVYKFWFHVYVTTKMHMLQTYHVFKYTILQSTAYLRKLGQLLIN
eukprot:TRINITY_DN6992_c0_g1_i2.p2 TRINITY_DN6992_c0_g1~~TRINITY_DN6992_c0_g1_i2.p2  ORF type:complete len:210 (+),score=-22.20 TRINITY_DN6992_c0_g1_i2:360-989(+)